MTVIQQKNPIADLFERPVDVSPRSFRRRPESLGSLYELRSKSSLSDDSFPDLQKQISFESFDSLSLYESSCASVSSSYSSSDICTEAETSDSGSDSDNEESFCSSETSSLQSDKTPSSLDVIEDQELYNEYNQLQQKSHEELSYSNYDIPPEYSANNQYHASYIGSPYAGVSGYTQVQPQYDYYGLLGAHIATATPPPSMISSLMASKSLNAGYTSTELCSPVYQARNYTKAIEISHASLQISGEREDMKNSDNSNVNGENHKGKNTLYTGYRFPQNLPPAQQQHQQQYLEAIVHMQQQQLQSIAMNTQMQIIPPVAVAPLPAPAIPRSYAAEMHCLDSQQSKTSSFIQNKQVTSSLSTETSPFTDSNTNQPSACCMSSKDMLDELRRKVKDMSTCNESTGYCDNSKIDMSNISVDIDVSWGIEEMKEYIFDFARDQCGSRYIQCMLEDSRISIVDKQALFEDILPLAQLLCKDQFGNYIIQRLLDPEVGTPSQQLRLCEDVFKGKLLDLSTDIYGCRVIQKLVELFFGFTNSNSTSPIFDRKYQDNLLLELSNNALECVKDPNGNHVMQKYIEYVRPVSRLDKVLDSLKGKYAALCKDPYGCRVVQRVLKVDDPARVLDALNEITKGMKELMSDQYANYVIQHIIIEHQQKCGDHRRALFKTVIDNILTLAQHKFGSNVVETWIKYGTKKEREALIDIILKGPSPPLVTMMRDPYANYVIQRVIDRANKSQYNKVLSFITANESSLKQLPFGKHILYKIGQHRY